MYLRFVVTQVDEDSHQPKGLFVAAHEILESGDMSLDDRKQLREVLFWFNKNLPSPYISGPKNQVAYRAIFWFKAEAAECIARIWEMARYLQHHGYLVEVQKCRTLGNIIYEDQFQVAAFPSKDDRK